MKTAGIAFGIICGSFLFPAAAQAQQQVPVEVNSTGKTDFTKGKFSPNSFQRSHLTASQMAKTKKIYLALHEVDPSSLQKWVDDFRRDANPDHEIAIWEEIARCYTLYNSKKKLPLPVKDEVLQVLLMRSGAPAPAVLQHIKLRYLPMSEARVVVQMYKSPPSPIQVKSAK